LDSIFFYKLNFRTVTKDKDLASLLFNKLNESCLYRKTSKKQMLLEVKYYFGTNDMFPNYFTLIENVKDPNFKILESILISTQ